MCEFDLLIVDGKMHRNRQDNYITIYLLFRPYLQSSLAGCIYLDCRMYICMNLLERENLVHNRHCVCFLCVSLN